MALWGNDDNIQSPGTVSLDYATGIVTATGANFGTYGKVGDVIRFGFRGDSGTFMGDAVITSVSTAQTCSIANTYGLSGAAIAGTSYYLSELPIYTAGYDQRWSNNHEAGYDRQIYGISTNTAQTFDGVSTKYRTGGSGWVGVTTYNDCDGNYRVKSEILVAMGGSAGIETGSDGIAYPTPQ